MSTNRVDKKELNPFIRLDSIDCKLIRTRRSSGGGWDFIDSTNRISVYPRQFLDAYDLLSGNHNARDLLIYIMERLAVHKDQIQLQIDKVSDKLTIPRSTLYDTIDRLSSLDFIRRTGKRNMYWINPYLFFKGNRLSHYPEAILYSGTETLIADRIKRDLIEEKFPSLKKARMESYTED